jgi:hypothetical protein
MKIETKRGQLEAIAWHVGRHVMIVAQGNTHFRIDGKPVAQLYQALQKQAVSIIEVDFYGAVYNLHLDTTNGRCILSVNTLAPIEMTPNGHMELLAVFETAFTQSSLGVGEMMEDEERSRYGLPPKRGSES